MRRSILGSGGGKGLKGTLKACAENISSRDRSPEVMPTSSMAAHRSSTTAFKDVESPYLAQCLLDGLYTFSFNSCGKASTNQSE